MEQTKITLDENEMPRQWYNVLSDLSSPIEPPLDPRTWEPVSPEALELIFAKALIKQEMSDERFIDIPEEIHEIYKLWRPSPLYRAHRLEKALKTPAKIYYKYEGVSPAGSHKTNTSIAQAYYNMKEGTERMTTETGAGQWGSALALACNYFELECKVYMVRSSYYQKPYRKSMMTVWGGNVVPSPSPDTEFGRKILEEQPDTPGSLGIAISEAVEDAIIGSECKKQLEKVETYPDIVIGCCGGGSNLAGISLEFIKDRLEGKGNARVIAVEPSACPTLTKGEYRYDYGDTAEMTPLLKMYTLGHKHVPPAIHAGGLRYHGDSPIISKLYAERLIEAVSYDQYPVFDAGVQFARTEGIVPAPESLMLSDVQSMKPSNAEKPGKKKQSSSTSAGTDIST
jgi:tryptophan synthase beta chain